MRISNPGNGSSLNSLSVIGVETARGLCTVELVEGDVTQVSCDLLAVSAYQGGYFPTPGTVLGALQENHNFWLSDENVRPAFDLRDQFGIWVTQELLNLPFRRVLAVEMTALGPETGMLLRQLEESVENVFVGLAILESKGIDVRRLAMPMLGTGNQGLDPAAVVGPLIAKTRAAIARSSSLEKVQFVVRSSETAQLLLREIEREFGPTGPSLPTKALIGSLTEEIQSIATSLASSTAGIQHRVAEEMREVMRNGTPTTSSIGLLARRLAELVTDDLYRGASTIDLYRKIEALAQVGVSPWVVNYLHTLRVIGNEVVHLRERQNRLPPALSDEDIVMCLFCIQRVAQFWLDARRTPAADSDVGHRAGS
jgi:hypothetical protein